MFSFIYNADYNPESFPAFEAHVQEKTLASAWGEPPAVTPAGTSPLT